MGDAGSSGGGGLFRRGGSGVLSGATIVYHVLRNGVGGWLHRNRRLVHVLLALSSTLLAVLLRRWWRLRYPSAPLTTVENLAQRRQSVDGGGGYLLSSGSSAKFDVCIVGAGVSGATCAYYLAKSGKRVLLLDQYVYPRDKVCCGVITPAPQKHLRTMGILNELLDENKAYWVNSGGFVSPAGKSFVAHVSATSAFGRVLVVPRCYLDDKIVLAAERMGAYFVDGLKVTDTRFSPAERMWEISASGPDGSVLYTATMLVAADGAESNVARALNMHQTPPNSYGCCSYVLGDTPQNRGFATDCMLFYRERYLARLAYFGAFRVNENGIVLTSLFFDACHAHTSAEKERMAALHDSFIRNDASVRKAFADTPLEPSPVLGAYSRTQLVDVPYGNHVVLIGDAAGHSSPLSGNGIQYAMDGAKLASQVVIRGFAKGDLSKRFLRKYGAKITRQYRVEFLGARLTRALCVRFPTLLDAVATVIQRESGKFLSGWIRVIGGGSKLWLFRLDLGFTIMLEALVSHLFG